MPPVNRVVAVVRKARAIGSPWEHDLDRIFLHAPFDDPRLLAAILGQPVPTTPARLERHALRQDPGGLRLGLAPGTGGVAGAILSPTPEEADRLAFATAALGLAPLRVDVANAPAIGFRLDGDGQPSTPVTETRRAQLAEVLTEVMGHFGRRPVAEMPALLHGIGIRAFARTQGVQTAVPARLGRGFGPAEIEVVSRGYPYARYFGIEDHQLRHRRFDGRTSAIVDRAVFTSGDAVTVLPFDPRTGRVLLIEQFRAGPHARRDPRPWCLETVAGRRDRRETAEETARREAVEEAGVTLGRLERISSYYPSPAIMAEYLTSFVAEADLAAAGGVHGLAEEDEDIRVIVVPLEEALAALDSGEIATAPLMVSLLWLARNEARLRAAWG